jgi:hypothetical protein
MASWAAAGDPTYQIWMTHTPRGSVIDDLAGVGEEQNRLVSYSGDSVLMYTHCGTHVDTVNHFGYRGKVWNGFGGTAPICWPASNSAVHIYVRATSSVQCTPWLSPWLSLKFQPGPNEPVSPR